MKEVTRLYINITNRCNTSCPFCCMYSGEEKSKDMSFGVFKRIVNSTYGDFELQLEGGEPLLNKDLYLFIEYAISTNRCKKIIVLTNGICLKDHLKRLLDIHKWYGVPFEIKVSVNYWLMQKHENHLKEINDCAYAIEFVDGFDISLNTRKRHEDSWIDEEIKKFKMDNINHSYYLQSYGKMSGSDYGGVVIVQNIKDWKIYSVDGKCFEQDLVARSEHEKTIR